MRPQLGPLLLVRAGAGWMPFVLIFILILQMAHGPYRNRGGACLFPEGCFIPTLRMRRERLESAALAPRRRRQGRCQQCTSPDVSA